MPRVGAAPDLHDDQPPLAPGAELLDRAVCHHTACVDQHDRVAQTLDELELVAREDHGDAVVRCLPSQDAREHVDPDRVEARERFVQHQQLRLVHERRRELHPLLVPEGKRLDTIVDRSATPSSSMVSRARRRASAAPSPCNRARYTSCSSTRILG